MKRMLNYALLAMILFSLCSCASATPFSQLKPSITPEKPETGRVFFYRATSFGDAIQSDIIMNGETIGKSVAMGFFYKDCQPGRHEVITSTEANRKVSFTLEKGQTRFIRFKVSPGSSPGQIYGELVDPREAMPEIQNCMLTGLEKPGAAQGFDDVDSGDNY